MNKLNSARFVVANLLAALLIGCATLTAKLASPQVSLADIQILQLGLFEQRYQIDLRIQNPNAIALPITGMSYDLDINRQKFARGVSNDVVNVPAYGEAVARVIVTSDLASVLQQLPQLTSDKPSLHYRLNGTVQLSRAQISLPFSYEGDLTPSGQK